MKPILFLDIDGVLNSVEWAMRKRQQEVIDGKQPTGGVFGVDPECIRHLQRIIDETDCELVLSSSWRRIHPLHEVRGILYRAGLLRGNLIGKTPHHYGAKRGQEVSTWMNQHLDKTLIPTDDHGILKIISYCCLDDGSDYLPGQPLIQTDNQVGLTATKADACIIILKTTSEV